MESVAKEITSLSNSFFMTKSYKVALVWPVIEAQITGLYRFPILFPTLWVVGIVGDCLRLYFS